MFRTGFHHSKMSSYKINLKKIGCVACNAYLEVDDDGPYKSKSKFWISIDDIFRTYVNYTDFLVVEELQSGVDIVKHVEPHRTSFPRLKKKYCIKFAIYMN